jgi:DNA-binding response OmpR family regulator
MVSCLLVDSHSKERERISALLEQLGIVASHCSDIEAGIAMCQSQNPDIVLMDASELPHSRDFLRLTRHRYQSSGRPIVILYACEADMAKMGESILMGASEFLMAPFDLDLLRFKLQQSGILMAHAA